MHRRTRGEWGEGKDSWLNSYSLGVSNFPSQSCSIMGGGGASNWLFSPGERISSFATITTLMNGPWNKDCTHADIWDQKCSTFIKKVFSIGDLKLAPFSEFFKLSFHPPRCVWCSFPLIKVKIKQLSYNNMDTLSCLNSILIMKTCKYLQFSHCASLCYLDKLAALQRK